VGFILNNAFFVPALQNSYLEKLKIYRRYLRTERPSNENEKSFSSTDFLIGFQRSKIVIRATIPDNKITKNANFFFLADVFET
jgi:hypothetical protein